MRAYTDAVSPLDHFWDAVEGRTVWISPESKNAPLKQTAQLFILQIFIIVIYYRIRSNVDAHHQENGVL